MHLTKARFSQLPQLPAVQAVKIAGVDASVPFHYQLHLTMASLSAGLRLPAHEDSQPVVDVPDGNEVSRKKIPPPQVKYPHQELAVLLCLSLIHI